METKVKNVFDALDIPMLLMSLLVCISLAVLITAFACQIYASNQSIVKSKPIMINEKVYKCAMVLE